MNFGENLQALRKSKNYSQEELAEKLDVSRQAVSKWESSSGMPETEKLIHICDIFDCSMDELVRGKISADANEEKKKYDSLMDKFSKGIAFAIMLILIGCTLMLTAMGFNENGGIGVVILLVFIVFAVPIFILRGMEKENFKNKYPKLSNFYTEEEIERYNYKFSKMIALSVGIILVGVVVFISFIYLNIFDEDSTFPVSILMCFISIAVPIIVYSGINKDRYDIEKYNNESSSKLNENSDKIGKISGVIMLCATIIYLFISFVFNLWYISWIIYPICGMLCGIISIILKK